MCTMCYHAAACSQCGLPQVQPRHAGGSQVLLGPGVLMGRQGHSATERPLDQNSYVWLL